MDLRERVMAAVGGGMSCRAAAARFGVGVLSAIRWRQQRRRGDVKPGRPGGDVRSSEAHGSFLLTLDEIRDALAGRGLRVSLATVWHFFHRHQITRKKVSLCDRTGAARHSEPMLGMVRGPARCRPEPPGVHRRSRRRTRSGQSWASTSMARRHGRCRRRRASRPSALQPRVQPGRKGVLEAQSPPPQSRRAHHSRPLDRHWTHPQPLLPPKCANYFKACKYKPE